MKPMVFICTLLLLTLDCNAQKEYNMKMPEINADYEFFDKDSLFDFGNLKQEYKKKVLNNDTVDNYYTTKTQCSKHDTSNIVRPRKEMKRNDTIKILDEHNDCYIVRERINKSAFSTVKKYSKPSLTLSIEGQSFYDLSIGLWKYYDEEGNLINTRNFDKEQGFSFSIEMLIKKIKKEYNIDLSFPTNNFMTVLRGKEDDKPIYVIHIPLTDFVPTRVIKIDGVIGKLISDEIENPKFGEND